MSSSTFKIIKQCKHCGKMFEAQKITTSYCAHKCSAANYKLRKKLERSGEAVTLVNTVSKFTPQTTALNKALIKDKEFLTVKDVSSLFGCTVKTVYSFIKEGTLQATNLSKRKTLLKRSEIDKLFESKDTNPKQAELPDMKDCYNILDVQKKYKISYNGLNAIIKRNNIPKQKKGVYTFVPKSLIDNLFN